MGSERRRTRKPRYERRIVTLALLTGLPAVILALVLLWSGDFAARTQWTLTILLVAVVPVFFVDREGRGLHDRAAGTVLVRSR